jgi:hypothetical protein
VGDPSDDSARLWRVVLAAACAEPDWTDCNVIAWNVCGRDGDALALVEASRDAITHIQDCPEVREVRTAQDGVYLDGPTRTVWLVTDATSYTFAGQV